MVFSIPSWVIYTLIILSLFIALFYLLTFIQTRKQLYVEEKKRNKNVTFLIPAYNVDKILGRVIKSIFSLDYPKNKIKIIIIDDGSTDNTLQVAKNLAKKYKNIKVFHKKNEGKRKALNYGINKLNSMKTELTAILDADTFIKPDLLALSVGLINNKTIAVTCRFLPLQKKGFFVRMQLVEYTLTSFFRKLLSNLNALPIAPAFTLFNTSWLKKEKYDEKNITEDFEMALRIHSKGYNMGYVFESYAITKVPEKFKDLQRQRIRWNYGTLYNLIKYKGLFKGHGILSNFLLPSMIFGMVSLVLVFFFGLYTIISETINYIQAINVGWIPSFSFTLDTLYFFFADTKIILGIIGVAIVLFFFVFIRKETKAKIRLFEYIIYIVVYIWFLAYFYILGMLRYFINPKKMPSW